ncbi:keratin-associated protein 4-12-like isoform X2 [Vanessa tameamea]|uniref:Keratin-associated protein 4-12-like isoform X2 n=1 Tax=Vanessa tameamea TaxID=334116 RepID=A0ABM4ASQ4_VANTA
MAYCFDELENYAVTPMLATPCVPDQCCERSPVCCASLPRCQKGEIVYVEKPQTKCYKKTNATNYNCCSECSKQSRSPEPLRRQTCCSSQEYCPTCNKCNPCKSIKTKYVIPCYRYEDGRIVNQPTVLMRRACEVAVGARPRRKPFVESCYSADPDQQIHRYVSQDERKILWSECETELPGKQRIKEIRNKTPIN